MGLGTVRFIAFCAGDADRVLENAKDVLRSVDESYGIPWHDSSWSERLPSRFVARCAPKMTRDQADIELARLSRLSPAEQIADSKKSAWSLQNWLSYFEPGERQWYWWDGAILEGGDLIVAVEVLHFPGSH